jgi:hypothetical protein
MAFRWITFALGCTWLVFGREDWTIHSLVDLPFEVIAVAAFGFFCIGMVALASWWLGFLEEEESNG